MMSGLKVTFYLISGAKRHIFLSQVGLALVFVNTVPGFRVAYCLLLKRCVQKEISKKERKEKITPFTSKSQLPFPTVLYST